jgi:hypothetical protein
LRYQRQNQVRTEWLGSVSYDRSTYEQGGGIVEVPYETEFASRIDEGQLLLFFDEAGHDKLAEVELAVETDERGIYLDLGEKEEKEINIRIFRKGKAPDKAVTIKIEHYITTNYDDVLPFPPNPAPLPLHLVDIKIKSEKGVQMRSHGQQAEILVEPASQGRISLSLTPKKAGTCIIRFVPLEQPGGPFKKTFGTSFFTNVRVLPEDNYDAELKEPAFQDIYDNVLRYYHLLYPNHPFEFSDYEEKMKQHAAAFKARIAKDMWHSARYMPRTRDLSHGKRKLLEKWCDKIIIEQNKQGSYTTATGQPQPDLDDLTDIDGIGEAYQHKLHQLGIYSFKELAEADPEELHQKLAIKSWQKVDVADWIRQSREKLQ